ncbi:MAG: Lar family restriction alleviation protein [Oscillospiraceae bacterium]|nr:Lar family restriction alleviation protein [Oscillospiraceae bacterium]
MDDRTGKSGDIHQDLELQDCPYCGGPGLLEEENGWCWYAVCMDCGAHTAHFEYRRPSERREAAEKAAHLWNIGKILRSGLGD